MVDESSFRLVPWIQRIAARSPLISSQYLSDLSQRGDHRHSMGSSRTLDTQAEEGTML